MAPLAQRFITYRIQPYGRASTGLDNPRVLSGVGIGVGMLCLFCVSEMRVETPMFPTAPLPDQAVRPPETWPRS
jgi:hypothetical protein